MADSLNAEQVEQYLLGKPEAALDYPFGVDVKVFKVKNKIVHSGFLNFYLSVYLLV